MTNYFELYQYHIGRILCIGTIMYQSQKLYQSFFTSSYVSMYQSEKLYEQYFWYNFNDKSFSGTYLRKKNQFERGGLNHYINRVKLARSLGQTTTLQPLHITPNKSHLACHKSR